MKFTYPIDDRTTCEKEQDWQPEECESKGGHCWVEYQHPFSNSERERNCKHCGLKQTLRIEHNEIWE